MINAFVARTRGLIGSNEQDGIESSEPEQQVSTTLFHCDACNCTYVGEEMETCSDCGGDLEVVPDEHELGIL